MDNFISGHQYARKWRTNSLDFVYKSATIRCLDSSPNEYKKKTPSMEFNCKTYMLTNN